MATVCKLLHFSAQAFEEVLHFSSPYIWMRVYIYKESYWMFNLHFMYLKLSQNVFACSGPFLKVLWK